MMIAISTLTVDPFGAQLLDLDPARTRLGDTARRVSRVATLDGGATILDGGYSVADKTITLDLGGQAQATVDALKYLCQVYGKLLVMTPDGAYTATPERITETGRAASFSLLVSGVAEVKA